MMKKLIATAGGEARKEMRNVYIEGFRGRGLE
jgi:hypothetical protein